MMQIIIGNDLLIILKKYCIQKFWSLGDISYESYRCVLVKCNSKKSSTIQQVLPNTFQGNRKVFPYNFTLVIFTLVGKIIQMRKTFKTVLDVQKNKSLKIREGNV